jgi:hypothetical protein
LDRGASDEWQGQKFQALSDGKREGPMTKKQAGVEVSRSAVYARFKQLI